MFDLKSISQCAPVNSLFWWHLLPYFTCLHAGIGRLHYQHGKSHNSSGDAWRKWYIDYVFSRAQSLSLPHQHEGSLVGETNENKDNEVALQGNDLATRFYYYSQSHLTCLRPLDYRQPDIPPQLRASRYSSLTRGFGASPRKTLRVFIFSDPSRFATLLGTSTKSLRPYVYWPLEICTANTPSLYIS